MNTDNWYNRLANLIIGLSLLIISFGWWPAFRAFRAGGLNKFGFGEAGYLHTESWTSPDNGWCAIPRPSGTRHGQFAQGTSSLCSRGLDQLGQLAARRALEHGDVDHRLRHPLVHLHRTQFDRVLRVRGRQLPLCGPRSAASGF